MPKSNEDVVFFSFRMSLNNPQHLKIAKHLNQIGAGKERSKNQFVADAIEFYLDHLDKVVPDDAEYVTRKELEKIKREMLEEVLTMVKVEMMHSYNVYAVSGSIPGQSAREIGKEAETDDVIASLVSDWD